MSGKGNQNESATNIAEQRGDRYDLYALHSWQTLGFTRIPRTAVGVAYFGQLVETWLINCLTSILSECLMAYWFSERFPSQARVRRRKPTRAELFRACPTLGDSPTPRPSRLQSAAHRRKEKLSRSTRANNIHYLNYFLNTYNVNNWYWITFIIKPP